MIFESCNSCKYFGAGCCKLYPPVRLPRKFSDDATPGNRVRDERLLWGWPEVKATDWCGQYVLAPAFKD